MHHVFTLCQPTLSSILPIPYCFARAGIIPGLILAVLVAYANALTARLLIDAAHRLNHDSYDALATAIAGRAGRIVAQCSLVLLLFGSFTGSCTLLADVGSMALKRLVVDQQDPWLVWLTAQGGRGIMLVLVCSICLPLSLLQHIRMVRASTCCAHECNKYTCFYTYTHAHMYHSWIEQQQWDSYHWQSWL